MLWRLYPCDEDVYSKVADIVDGENELKSQD